MQEPRCSRASLRVLMVSWDQAECWDVGVGQGLRSCCFSTCELLRMVGYGQHHIFSLWCPSRGVVNIPHHCLFKEDGVRVRSNGKSNPKSQVFSVSGETLWIEPGLSNCALNAWGFSCLFPTVLVNLMKPFESFNKCYTSIQKYVTCCYLQFSCGWAVLLHHLSLIKPIDGQWKCS